MQTSWIMISEKETLFMVLISQIFVFCFLPVLCLRACLGLIKSVDIEKQLVVIDCKTKLPLAFGHIKLVPYLFLE